MKQMMDTVEFIQEILKANYLRSFVLEARVGQQSLNKTRALSPNKL